MKLSKIAALFMVPVLALSLVAVRLSGGNASESTGSDPKIAGAHCARAGLTPTRPLSSMRSSRRSRTISSWSDNALWEKGVFCRQ